MDVQGVGAAVVLSIGRMARGSGEYYLSTVASGVEDYYLGRGEAPGWWAGTGAATLGLAGTVEPAALRAVLAGCDPASGEALSAARGRSVPGFDLTFCAPKSVALLWALADEDVSRQVRAAHDTAVAAALGYLEREAGWTRRGTGGAERVRVEGFVAAAFRHRTSRAGDPLLHTHVLVANLAKTADDGRWRTLDGRQLFLQAKTASLLYQAQLRCELTRTLGVAFEDNPNGHADLAGVPRDWIEAFSQRRAAIVAELDRHGDSSAAAAQVATLTTRTPKEQQRAEPDLRARWAGRAAELGIPTGWWRELLHRAELQPPDLARLYQELVAEEGLTAETSTFARRDVLQAVATRLPTGAPVEQVEELAHTLLTADGEQILELGASRGQLRAVDGIQRRDGRFVPADPHEPRYTTRGLLLLEQRAIQRAQVRADDGLAVIQNPALPAALSAEQAALVRRLTTSGAGVEVVVGKAGTGKTYALDAARRAWQQAGTPVTGVALAARAALELQDTAGIPSTTLARLLTQMDDPRPGSPLAPGSVLVVDEAAMIATRELARLLDHAETQQVKVVLVGDHHQLPELAAGGLFRALATRLPAVELTENRRQTHSWEATALDELRAGAVPDAVAAYHQQGRLITADGAEALREQLVADWWHTSEQLGAPSAVMVALRRGDVADLNARARTRLTAAGRLTGPTLTAGESEFRAGDRIVCLKNDCRLGVVNGTRATVTTVDPAQRRLIVRTDDDRDVSLPARYLDAGQLAHGYAITGHKAQGLTVEHTFVLGSPELYREWGYVALSRGRETNRLYVHAGAREDPEVERHHRAPPVDPVGSLTARLERTRAQTPVSPAARDEADRLGERWRALSRWLAEPAVAHQGELTQRRQQLTRQRQDLADQLARDEQQHQRLTRGLARLGHHQQRAELDTRIQDHRENLDTLDAQLGEIDRELATLPDAQTIAAARDEIASVGLQLTRAVQARVEAFEADPPAYLQTTLGAPPDQPNQRDRWREAAWAVETYRLRRGIEDPHRPLGDEPADPAQRREHHHLAADLDRARHELTREASRDRGLDRGPGLELG